MEREDFWFKDDPVSLNECNGQGEKAVEKKEGTEGLKE